MDFYESFRELRSHEKEGRDYHIRMRLGSSGIAVMAPHGGDIEPGTSELADAIAAEDHNFYSFEGARSSENLRLHITSTRFDEPAGAEVARLSRVIVAIHGCRGREAMVCLGGLDRCLKKRVDEALAKTGFRVGGRSGLGGTSSLNLCNRGTGKAGVQIEVTSALRRTMFHDLTRQNRIHTTEAFYAFVSAIRNALLNYRLDIS